MPASAAITNGSLVRDTSPSSMLIGSCCACAEGAATAAMAARRSALAKWLCMIDLPSTNRSCAHHIRTPHRRTAEYRIKIAPASWNVVNDICCVCTPYCHQVYARLTLQLGATFSCRRSNHESAVPRQHEQALCLLQ